MLDRDEKRSLWIEANLEEWQEVGARHRKMRNDAGLTLARMSELTGFSACKLGSFELGKPVGTRKVLERIYPLAIMAMGGGRL